MIAFPANPEVNDTYTAAGRTWLWNGTVWQLQPRTLTSADIVDFSEAVGNTAPPTTDAALLTSGTLPDERLSAAVTASLALADTSSQPGHGHTIAEVTGLQTALDGKQASGSYATLVNGLVPADQLPSYVDDVVEFANLAAFPEVGETGKIYTAIDTRKIYRWSGSVYIEISPSEVTSVAGKTGAVTLEKSDVGLGNVDNTSDLDKPISTATQAALDGKAASSHTHTIADLTDAGQPGGVAIQGLTFNGQVRQAAELADVALGDETVLSFFDGETFLNETYKSGFRAAIDSQIRTIYSDTPPQHTPGLEWVDTTDLRSYRSYNGLWIEIDRA